MGLFTPAAQQKTCLHFFDDNTFIFRNLPLEDTGLIEKKDQRKIGWKHLYGLEKDFYGFSKVKRARVTLTCERDIILDPFNQMPLADKTITKGNTVKPPWITSLAESQRYKVEQKVSGKRPVSNRMIAILGWLCTLFAFLLALQIIITKWSSLK